MFLGECPAFPLLPVTALQRLPACRLYLITDFPVFRHAVIIDRLPLLVYTFHELPFLPVQPVGQLLNMHFQRAVFCSSFNQILMQMLSAVGCVNS